MTDLDAKLHVDVVELFQGGVIGTAEIARRFGELVLEHTQSKSGLQAQLPLTVEDQGDAWLVRGSRNRDHSQEGAGPFRMVVKKRDAQVIDVAVYYVVKIAAEDQELFREAFRKAGRPPPDF
jgi:hypothetical protein